MKPIEIKNEFLNEKIKGKFLWSFMLEHMVENAEN